jgi:hypothetical protein
LKATTVSHRKQFSLYDENFALLNAELKEKTAHGTHRLQVAEASISEAKS